MGYSGGTLPSPTYHKLGTHAETIEIVYDPAKVSYRDLLDVYWQNTAVTVPAWSSQYASIIFYHNDEQKRLAEETRDDLEVLYDVDIHVKIVPAAEFHPAEDYHQKYYLQQNSKLTREMTSIYPEFEDFLNSTAVARLNGFAGGFGTPESLDNLERLGLSPEGMQEVRDITKRGLMPACPVLLKQ